MVLVFIYVFFFPFKFYIILTSSTCACFYFNRDFHDFLTWKRPHTLQNEKKKITYVQSCFQEGIIGVIYDHVKEPFESTFNMRPESTHAVSRELYVIAWERCEEKHVKIKIMCPKKKKKKHALHVSWRHYMSEKKKHPPIHIFSCGTFVYNYFYEW